MTAYFASIVDGKVSIRRARVVRRDGDTVQIEGSKGVFSLKNDFIALSEDGSVQKLRAFHATCVDAARKKLDREEADLAALDAYLAREETFTLCG